MAHDTDAVRSQPGGRRPPTHSEVPDMGLIRKLTSASTLGADYRSDKERTARNTKKTAKELKRANDIAERESRRK
jgi:hypothetical protein